MEDLSGFKVKLISQKTVTENVTNDSVVSLNNDILLENYFEKDIPETFVDLSNEPIIEVVYVESNPQENVKLERMDKSVMILENSALDSELTPYIPMENSSSYRELTSTEDFESGRSNKEYLKKVLEKRKIFDFVQTQTEREQQEVLDANTNSDDIAGL